MSEFQPITSQEDFDNAIKERISRVEKKYEGFVSAENHQKAIDDLKSSYDSRISELNTKYQGYEDEKASWDAKEKDYTSKLKKYEDDSVKSMIASKYGLTSETLKYIQGSTKEEWEESAKELSSLLVSKGQPAKGNNQGSEVDGVTKAFKKLNPNLNI